MNNLAALMILVACPTDGTHCISKPLRVISYEAVADCQRELGTAIARSKRPGFKVYGSCNGFDRSLLADRPPINLALDLRTMKTAAMPHSKSESTASGYAP